MDETDPVEPAEARPAPQATPEPQQIAAITSLGIATALAVIIGIILLIVTFSIGDSTNLTVSDLAARIAWASIAGVAFTVGFIAAIAAGVLAGIREMLRRNRSGEPL